MVYVPTYNDNNCAVVTSDSKIRVYEYKPTNNSNVPYIDYYFNADYISYTGTQQFSQYTTIPNCRTDITTDFYYRTDIVDILLLFCILAYIGIICPIKLFLRIAKRFRW